MISTLGIWTVRREAVALAKILGERLHGTQYHSWEAAEGAHMARFHALYALHPRWIFVGAAGIAVRFLNGLTQDKKHDPGVVVVDEAGRFAVALLGGHEGGANALAYAVARHLGAVPVITTATEAVKPLVVGIGCRKGVAEQEITAQVLRALGDRAIREVREVATMDLKAREPGLAAFCTTHKLPLRVFSQPAIAARRWVTEPSAWVAEVAGVEGVCEPCALLACPRGHLLVPKQTGEGVAVAIVEDAPPFGAVPHRLGGHPG